MSSICECYIIQVFFFHFFGETRAHFLLFPVICVWTVQMSALNFKKLLTNKKDVEGLPAAALGLAAQMAVFKCGLMIIIFIIISNDTKPHKCYSREWAMGNHFEPSKLSFRHAAFSKSNTSNHARCSESRRTWAGTAGTSTGMASDGTLLDNSRAFCRCALAAYAISKTTLQRPSRESSRISVRPPCLTNKPCLEATLDGI